MVSQVWAIATDPDYRKGAATMKFRLSYAGPVMGAGNAGSRARHKQEIRQKFHPQLKRLWESHRGLGQRRAWLRKDYPTPGNGPGDADELRLEQLARENQRCGYRFVPLILEELEQICSIDILFLRPGIPGSILRSADLDARLKTIFDALRMPIDQPELGGYDAPREGEDPFFCLLQDDKLVSHVSVEADMLLEPTGPDAGDHDARLIITVEMTPFVTTLSNLL